MSYYPIKRMLQLLKYDLRFISWQNHLARFGVISVPMFLMVWSGSDPTRSLFYITTFVFLGLENVYTNIFFRVPNEMDSYTLLPVSYRKLIFVKNIAAIIVTLPALLVVGIITVYFSLTVPSLAQLHQMMLYVATLLFPLLHFGNVISLRYPRRYMRLDFEALVYLVFQLMAIAVSSIPYVVLKAVSDSDVPCLMFAVGGAFYWYSISVPRTARVFIEKQHQILESA
jgi:hypothetical protein